MSSSVQPQTRCTAHTHTPGHHHSSHQQQRASLPCVPVKQGETNQRRTTMTGDGEDRKRGTQGTTHGNMQHVVGGGASPTHKNNEASTHQASKQAGARYRIHHIHHCCITCVGRCLNHASTDPHHKGKADDDDDDRAKAIGWKKKKGIRLGKPAHTHTHAHTHIEL